jgi:hypothetical protein
MRSYRVLLVLVTAGCYAHSLNEPSVVVGTYALVTIQGHAPPQIVIDAPGCQITVIGGSLVLKPDRRFELWLQEVEACPTPTEPGTVAELFVGSYTLSGSNVVLHAVGDPSTDYYGRMRSGRLVVPLGYQFGDVEFTPP